MCLICVFRFFLDFLGFIVDLFRISKNLFSSSFIFDFLLVFSFSLYFYFILLFGLILVVYF